MSGQVRYGMTKLGVQLHVIREIVGGCARGWCGQVLVWIDADQSTPGPPHAICRRCLRCRPEDGAAPADQEAP